VSGPATTGDITRLAAPTILVTFVQAVAQTAEAALIGRLGTDALAGYALVLPLLMLMQMTSGGAMGGGVTAALARALGAGRIEDARALIRHAVAIALGMGLLTSVLALGLGPLLFRSVGGDGAAAIAHAMTYSGIVFGGAVLVWLSNILGAALRGAGKMRLPAMVMTAAWIIEAPLSGLLMLGWAGGSPARPSPTWSPSRCRQQPWRRSSRVAGRASGRPGSGSCGRNLSAASSRSARWQR
jgi:Na+-driven multidrug efflux pump